MSSPVSVIAIISAYNEADIIGQVVNDLVQQEVSVYLLDDGSTDDTVAVVTPFVGRGVIAIERFSTPDTDGRPHPFRWEAILRRKSQLAQQLEGDWFIHHDADEFRESPWPGISLRAAINFVHEAGYSAIDFACLEFCGEGETSSASLEARAAFPRFTHAEPYNRVQIRCWRRTDHAVDLASSGGHDAAFPDRRVFPIRFILRHYPIRGRAHFERKTRRERNYDEGERARGWHHHYSAVGADSSLASNPSAVYDPNAVRVDLMLRHRLVEDLEQTIGTLNDQARSLEANLQSRLRELETCQASVARTEALRQECLMVVEERGQLIEQIYQSKSWRWSAPARALARWLGLGG